VAYVLKSCGLTSLLTECIGQVSRGKSTDRQRIKRKAQRWGKNYKALPRTERLAVLAAMMEVEALENGMAQSKREAHHDR